jgi:beta-lactamase regulating signal transducer with metallopeptidase domain
MFNALLWNLLLTAGLAIVLAGVCRLSSLRKRPALRHWLWLLLLAKLVTPPLVAVPLLPAVAGVGDAAAIAISPDRPSVHGEPAWDQRIQANPAVDDASFGSANRGEVGTASPGLQNRVRMLFFGGLLAFSLLGTFVLWMVQGVHAVKLYRWLKRAGVEDSTLAAACAEVASSMAIRGDVRSCVVDARTTPLLWGWRRPLVVVPRQLMDDLGPQQLRGIVAHELAHFVRRDHWANLFVFIVKGLLWWNPVVWWADRELRAAQELCCDAIAIDRCKTDRRGYAVTLLKALDFIQTEPLAPCVLASGMGSRGSILRRFEMIGDAKLSYRLSRWTFLAMLALAIPLVCMPVHGREKGRLQAAPPATCDVGNDNTNANPIKTEQAKTAGAADKPAIDPDTKKAPTMPKEEVFGERPRGNCSISGKVIDEATDNPVEHARMYLFYNVTFGSIFIDTAADGTFAFKDIPKGPYSLQVSHTAGYQDVSYNPEGKPLPLPPFSFHDGEHRTGIVLKAKQACRISGKVLDENGKIPGKINTLEVLAWLKSDDGKGYHTEHAMVNRADGSYSIDGLDGKPVYVMAINWPAAREGNASPPVYYPGVFSRSDAKPITFDKEQSVKNINITLKKEGGLILEGTVRDEAGKPVPEAFVVVHRRDMLFDFVTAYTDKQGRYQIQGLGDGQFLVHVDAVHRGLVRTRTPVDLDKTSKNTQRDFTLVRGVLISGKFVDEKGHDWQIGASYGCANVVKDKQKQLSNSSSFSLTHFWNKHRPQDVKESAGGSFATGEGDYRDGEMLFPTPSTFILQGMMPGHTMIVFSPQKERQKVLKILQDGRDITKSGIETKPGQEMKDVTVVIGSP